MPERTATEALMASRESMSACSYTLLGARLSAEEYLGLRLALSETVRTLATVSALLAAAATRRDPAHRGTEAAAAAVALRAVVAALEHGHVGQP